MPEIWDQPGVAGLPIPVRLCHPLPVTEMSRFERNKKSGDSPLSLCPGDLGAAGWLSLGGAAGHGIR